MRIKALVAAGAVSLVAGTAFAGPGLDIPYGGVVVDGRDITAYVFVHDKPGNSYCHDDCAVSWGPLMAEDGARNKAAFTLARSRDGGHPCAYQSRRLYDWAGDAKPGDMKGADGRDAWRVVDKHGVCDRGREDGRGPSRQQNAEVNSMAELGMNDTANTRGNTIVLEHTTEIVAAYVSNNAVSAADLSDLIRNTYAALFLLQEGERVEPAVELIPAVPITKSVTSDYLICLEDGKKFKSLKRHLATHYNLAPEQYREKWNLPQDYPMTAPSYSATRSALAKANGLGRSQAASTTRSRDGGYKSTT